MKKIKKGETMRNKISLTNLSNKMLSEIKAGAGDIVCNCSCNCVCSCSWTLSFTSPGTSLGTSAAYSSYGSSMGTIPPSPR